MKILFVCTGNTCRSPMADAYFKDLCTKAGRSDIEVSSAGTFGGGGQAASQGTIKVMQEYGIDLSVHKSSQLTKELIKESDIIIAMAGSHKRQILAMDHSADDKTYLLLEFTDRGPDDVGDPFGWNMDAYAYCFSEMKPALDNLFLDIDKITNEDD